MAGAVLVIFLKNVPPVSMAFETREEAVSTYKRLADDHLIKDFDSLLQVETSHGNVACFKKIDIAGILLKLPNRAWQIEQIADNMVDQHRAQQMAQQKVQAIITPQPGTIFS